MDIFNPFCVQKFENKLQWRGIAKLLLLKKTLLDGLNVTPNSRLGLNIVCNSKEFIRGIILLRL